MKRIALIALCLLLMLPLPACAGPASGPTTVEKDEASDAGASPAGAPTGALTGDVQENTPQTPPKQSPAPSAESQTTPDPLTTAQSGTPSGEMSPSESDADPRLSFSVFRSGGVNGCKVSAVGEIVGEVTVPQSFAGKPVLAVAARAFEGQSRMTALYLPDSVVYLGEDCLSGCTALERLVLSKGIRQIGENSLACVSTHKSENVTNDVLRELIIPEGVEVIDSYAIEGFTALERVVLPSTLQKISDCLNLAPSTCRLEIDSLAHYCALEGRLHTPFLLSFGGQTPGDELIIPEGVEKIALQYAFAERSFTRAVFPSTLKSIADGAFAGTPLIEAVFSEGLVSIGRHTFGSCRLRSVELPQSLSEIGSCAFADNPLESLTLKGVRSIGQSAFKNTLLCSVTIPDGAKKLGRDCFDTMTLKEISLPGSLDVFWPFNTAPAPEKMIFRGVKRQLQNASKLALDEYGNEILLSWNAEMPAYFSFLTT